MSYDFVRRKSTYLRKGSTFRMPVLKNMEINLDAREVVLALHLGKKAPEAMIAETRNAIARSRELIQPRALYEWVKIAGVNGERVLLGTGNGGESTVLMVGPHADLLAEAELALVGVVTVGRDIDKQIDALNKAGKLLEAYLLDSVGVVALWEVGKAIREYAEKEAESRGWGVSPSLAPGSLQGWPITGQFDLCTLLPLHEIDVHLSESGVLVPFKSASSLIGLGRKYRSPKVGSVCRFCMRAETCWRRKQ